MRIAVRGRCLPLLAALAAGGAILCGSLTAPAASAATAGHDGVAGLTVRSTDASILTSASHHQVPARDAFSGRVTARTGLFRGEHGHATADLGVSASRAATRRLTLTFHARLCKKSKQCVRLTGHLKGTIKASAGTNHDKGRSFTIRVAGVIKRLGHVRVRGQVNGTGFVKQGHETIHLTSTSRAGRLALSARSPLVAGFSSP